MNRGMVELRQLSAELQAIATAVRTLAQSCQGDSLDLLALLRCLEELHRELRDGLFQSALPDNRQALYKLLKDIETEGGWPYIERMKLQSFLVNLPAEPFEALSNEQRLIEDKVPTNASTSDNMTESNSNS